MERKFSGEARTLKKCLADGAAYRLTLRRESHAPAGGRIPTATASPRSVPSLDEPLFPGSRHFHFHTLTSSMLSPFTLRGRMLTNFVSKPLFDI